MKRSQSKGVEIEEEKGVMRENLSGERDELEPSNGTSSPVRLN